MLEKMKKFLERHPNYWKEHYYKNHKKKLEQKKKQDSKKTKEDYRKKNKRHEELNPLKIKVGRYTNRVFVKEPVCTFSFCDDIDDLHFHHWRYRLPVQRQDFSTLCRKHHNLMHINLDTFFFIAKLGDVQGDGK